MTEREPIGKLDPTFSAPDATATPWAEARTMLEEAEIFWLSTVRPDGRPHGTLLISVWLDGAPWFVTGPTERKAVNLDGNQQSVLTTGCNDLNQGLDVVVEGVAVLESDEATLRRVADAFSAKYPEPFKFTFAPSTAGVARPWPCESKRAGYSPSAICRHPARPAGTSEKNRMTGAPEPQIPETGDEYRRLEVPTRLRNV